VLRANWLGYNMVIAMNDGVPSAFFGAKNVTDSPIRLPLVEAIKPEANLDDLPRQMIDLALALR
jgi:hypothetical protein